MIALENIKKCYRGVNLKEIYNPSYVVSILDYLKTVYQLNEQSVVIQQLTAENNKLKEQVSYLNNKITQLIKEQLEKRKDEKNKNP